MKTLILSGHNTNDIEKAGEILRSGGLVAIPTETVYGLAANALDGKVVRKIYEAKGRPSDNPLIVHISEFTQLKPLVREVPESARKLAAAFWPGPLTIILKKSELIPEETSGGLDTVAVRFPSHPIARAVIQAAGVPLAAPSANLSGKPSPTMFAHVQEDLNGRVDALLDGGDCAVGVESTVITLAEGTPRVLRPGGVTVSQLRSILGEVEVDDAVVHRLQEGKSAASPGMKYKHYSPKADVVIVDASPEEYVTFVNSKQNCHALCFDEDTEKLKVPFVSYGTRYDGEKQAHLLFSALHYLDEIGAQRVFAHIPSKSGVGLAVYNRLIRSAGFQIARPGTRRLVGLVGPSGAGKSTVSQLFCVLGCGAVDCDSLTRSSQGYDKACLLELARAFGEDILVDGGFNRALVAQRAFRTNQGKKILGKITFPRILRQMWKQVEEEERSGKKIILLDAPTLFEAGLDAVCCRIIAVSAPEEIRTSRIMARDGISQEQAALRLSAQQGNAFYTSRADFVVENRGEENLRDAVSKIFEELQGDSDTL